MDKNLKNVEIGKFIITTLDHNSIKYALRNIPKLVKSQTLVNMLVNVNIQVRPCKVCKFCVFLLQNEN